MYIKITVDHETASIHVNSGWGPGPHVTLTGSTCSASPIGTVVERFSVKIPQGLHGIAFFCKVPGPHAQGSGRTAYLDHTAYCSTNIIFSWWEGEKLIAKANDDMKAAELAQFNSFVCSDEKIFVVNMESKTAYVSELPCGPVDPTWTYKSVSMDAILEYITKKLTLEELDERATSEKRARDELRELKVVNGSLNEKVQDLQSQVAKLENTVRLYVEIADALLKSEPIQKSLKSLPAMVRPKIFDGLIKAIDLLARYRLR